MLKPSVCYEHHERSCLVHPLKYENLQNLKNENGEVYVI